MSDVCACSARSRSAGRSRGRRSRFASRLPPSPSRWRSSSVRRACARRARPEERHPDHRRLAARRARRGDPRAACGGRVGAARARRLASRAARGREHDGGGQHHPGRALPLCRRPAGRRDHRVRVGSAHLARAPVRAGARPGDRLRVRPRSAARRPADRARAAARGVRCASSSRPATRWRASAPCGCSTSPTRPGSAARRVRPATPSPSVPAARRASTRGSASSSTTTRRCRASSPRVRASLSRRTWGSRRVNPGVAVRPIAFGPKRRVHAALRAGEGDSAGVPEMLAALRESVAAREPLFPAVAGAS